MSQVGGPDRFGVDYDVFAAASLTVSPRREPEYGFML
jgi:hypothetical protein